MAPIPPLPPRSPSILAVISPVSPRTPDERHGEQDYFTRRVSVPGLVQRPNLSPGTLELGRPVPRIAVQPVEVEAPVRVPRIFGRRIPLPIRVSYALAGMAVTGLAAALTTLGIAISNRIARQKAGQPA